MAGIHLQKHLYPAERKMRVLEKLREKMSSRGQCSHGYGVCHAAEHCGAALHRRAPLGLYPGRFPRATTVPHWPCRGDSSETLENQESLIL